jgi:ABC-type uncharacterized transport system permease subunit
LTLLVEGALFLATALAYLAACALFVAYLSSERFAAAGKQAPRLVAVGAVLHASHILVASEVWHVCPVEGIHFAMSVVSMMACVVYLVMRRRYRIDVVGAFVAPLALTFLLASRFVGSQVALGEPSQRLKSAILPIHVTVNLLGDALFTLAFAAAVAYLLQERLLKEKRTSGLFRRLPPLDSLDRAEHRFLLAGFPLLTVGILTGTLWARHVEAGSTADIARAGLGYATWILFAGVLLLRAAAGWRGRRAAYGTIAGFGFAVLVLLLYLVRSIGAGSTTVTAFRECATENGHAERQAHSAFPFPFCIPHSREANPS